MKKAMIIIGAAGYNRGSEILLTGILQLLKKQGKYSVIISSFDLREGWAKENAQLYDEFVPREANLTHQSPFIYKLNVLLGTKLFKKRGYKHTTVRMMRYPLCQKFAEMDLILFVGADNFDYDTTEINELNSLVHIACRKCRGQVGIIDTSIEKKNINKYLIKNVREADFVSVRDSFSLEALSGIDKKVVFHADPAFTVKGTPVESYPSSDSRYVGINISPLVLQQNEITLNNVATMLQWILDNTEDNVLLIPHVMRKQDYSALSKLKDLFADEPRVILLEDDKYSATELKYIISKCDAYVGARTHSVIAAYSSGVPTLAIGYSIKSSGIAKDLLGEDCYCIQASELERENDLKQKFVALWENRNLVHQKLQEKMPDYLKTVNNFFGEL